MLKKLLNLFPSESNILELNKEDMSYEEFLEPIIDEKFLIDEY